MSETVDQLLFAIVQAVDADRAIIALAREGLRATRISSMGGFLHTGNVTLLLGLARSDSKRAMHLLSEYCRKRTVFVNAAGSQAGYSIAAGILPVEVEIGGASIFGLPVERYLRFGAEPADIRIPPVKESSMKLVLAIVPADMSETLIKALTSAQCRVTLISTTGGFLRKGNATLVIGVESERLASVVQQLEAVCGSRAAGEQEAEACATVFVLGVDQYMRV